MKNLIIIGAGGFGREIYNSAKGSIGYLDDFDIKGFLDDNAEALNKFQGYPPIIGSVSDYIPQKDDVFVCAMGNVFTKKKVCEIIMGKGGSFYTLIHKNAYICDMNVKIGTGCIILEGARIHCDATLGNFVTMQPYSIIGHDIVVGDWSLLNSHVVIGGASIISPLVTMHTTSVVVPQSSVGEGVTIGAGSVAMRKVKAGQTVFGVPAKPILVPTFEKK